MHVFSLQDSSSCKEKRSAKDATGAQRKMQAVACAHRRAQSASALCDFYGQFVLKNFKKVFIYPLTW